MQETSLWESKIGCFSGDKDHIYSRTKRELLTDWEHYEQFKVEPTGIGVTWGYSGERILRNTSSLVNSDKIYW